MKSFWEDIIRVVEFLIGFIAIKASYLLGIMARNKMRERKCKILNNDKKKEKSKRA